MGCNFGVVMRIWLKVISFVLVGFLIAFLSSCGANSQQLEFDGNSYVSFVENFVGENSGKAKPFKKTEQHVGAIFSVDTSDSSQSYVVKVNAINDSPYNESYFFLITPDGKENKIVGSIKLSLSKAYIVNGNIRIPSVFSSDSDRISAFDSKPANSYVFNKKIYVLAFNTNMESPVAAQMYPVTPVELGNPNFRSNQVYIEISSTINAQPTELTNLELRTS